MTTLTKADWETLEAELPEDGLVTDPIELITYEVDGGLNRGVPQAVAFPRSPDDVVGLVRWAAEHEMPLVARGAGTGLSGGAVPSQGGLVLSFSRMKEVLELDEKGRSVVAQPGVVNLTLDEMVKRRGLYYPPDPASGRSATLGGNLAENAGGPHCFKYGVTTNYVTGLQVVTANGELTRTGGRALDYPEYDFTGLLVGSEGTLAIVTEASLRLMRNPQGVRTLMASFDSVEAAGEAVSALIAQGLVPATMEMMDRNMVGIIEDYIHAGLPTEAAAMLIVEAHRRGRRLPRELGPADGRNRPYPGSTGGA
jgi:D-lactate dehydrogenase (cytochrome)